MILTAALCIVVMCMAVLTRIFFDKNSLLVIICAGQITFSILIMTMGSISMGVLILILTAVLVPVILSDPIPWFQKFSPGKPVGVSGTSSLIIMLAGIIGWFFWAMHATSDLPSDAVAVTEPAGVSALQMFTLLLSEYSVALAMVSVFMLISFFYLNSLNKLDSRKEVSSNE